MKNASVALCFGPITRQFVLALFLGLARVCIASSEFSPTIKTIDRIANVERELLADEGLKSYGYDIVAQFADGDGTVKSDEVRWGKARLGPEGPSLTEFQALLVRPKRSAKTVLLTQGLLRVMFPDNSGVDADRYDWSYKGPEKLGAVACQAFDVTPKPAAGYGTFVGRLWIAEDDLAIVRFNGTFTAPPKRASPYFHFVSWRVKSEGGLWLPAGAYIEEKKLVTPIGNGTALRARITFWGYHGSGSGMIRIPKGEPATVSDEATLDQDPDIFYHEMETKILAKLEEIGALAPAGDVEKKMDNIVGNLLLTNNLDYRFPIHCRILISSVAEAFPIGWTILVSRTLIDSAPDDAALALIIAPQVAHVLLKHRIDKKPIFDDLLLASPDQVLKNMNFRRTPKENEEAENLGLHLLTESPTYQAKLASAALFLGALPQYCEQMRTLFATRLGDPLPGCRPTVFNRLLALRPRNSDQPLALPLGARIVVDPADGLLQMVEPPLESGPFRVVPLVLPPKDSVQAQRAHSLIPPVSRPQTPAPPMWK